MDFEWTDEQRAYHDSVVSFAQNRLSRDMLRRDAEHVFSREDWERCAEIGIQGLPVPEEYGGAGSSASTIVFALEALGYGCRDNGLIFALNAQMWACEVPLVRFGSEAQRRRYLPGLCDGTLIGAQAMTEPETGSDAFNVGATARPHGDSGYVLDGRKTFVTNAPQADVVVVYAATEPLDGSLGISVFLVDRETQDY